MMFSIIMSLSNFTEIPDNAKKFRKPKNDIAFY